MKSQIVLYFALIVLTFFGLFLRVYHISEIPASITYDEIDHVVNGLGIFYTSKDFQGQHYFWELKPTASHTYTAEISALWHAFKPIFPQDPLLYARLPNILAGIFFSLALSLFSYQLFRSWRIAFIVLPLILLSPWHILLSRTAYEAPISLFWLLLSVMTFSETLTRKNFYHKCIFFLLTTISLLASFYTYHGYKPIYPFIFILLFLYHHRQFVTDLLKRKKSLLLKTIPLIAILVIWVIAFFSFTHNLATGEYGNRSKEIVFLNTQSLTNEVNERRKASLDSRYSHLFVNKGTLAMQYWLQNALKPFDPTVLFVTGYDESYMIGLWEHGFLYIIQLPIILLSLVWLFLHKRRTAIFLVSLLCICLIPAIIHYGASYVLRSSLFIPILIIFSAIGFEILLVRKYRYKLVILIVTTICFIVSVLNFQNFYFTRYPINTIDTTFFQERLLATYLKKASTSNQQITVFVSEPFNTIRAYAFFDNKINAHTITHWQDILNNSQKDTYTFGNITFTRNCRKLNDLNNSKSIFILDENKDEGCKELKKITDNKTISYNPIILPSPKDNREYYKIFNDTVCLNQNISAAIHIRNIQMFALEKMSTQDFCTQWVAKP